jgi:hypothetical protein
MKARTLILILAITLCSELLAPLLDAQQVLLRRRLGNNSEGMTTIHAGPLNGTIAIMDGTDVIAFADGGRGSIPPRELFSVLGLGTNVGPRGIAYIDDEQRFVFDDPSLPNTLFLSDNQGKAAGTINVTFPGGFVPDDTEGMVWLPPTAVQFGNHILEIAASFATLPPTVTIEVIDRNTGQVVAGIQPNVTLTTPFDFLVGLGFQFPDRLLVSGTDGTIWQIDFSGNVTAGPVSFPNVGDVESVSQVDSNRIAAAGYDAGKVMFLDANLTPLAGQDRSYLIGFGLSQSTGVAWDSDLQRHLISFPGFTPPASAEQIISLAPILGDERRAVDTSTVANPQALSYLPDEHRIALSQTGCFPNCVIFLYDNSGNLVDQVPVGLGLRSMTYIPTTKQFAGANPGNLTTLLFFARNGTLVNSIDLSPTGIDEIFAITFFNSGRTPGGEFLLLSSPVTHQAFVIDSAGAVLKQFDYKTALGAVNVRDVATIASVPPNGFFSLVSQDTSEIVIFRF